MAANQDEEQVAPLVGIAKLPTELLDKIVDHALVAQPYEQHNLGILCNLSRVCRRWYDVINERLYSKLFYDGRFHTTNRLWHLLRTILSNRRFAERVRSIDIFNMCTMWTVQKGQISRPGDPPNLSERDLSLLRSAIAGSALQHMSDEAERAYQQADPLLFIALLIANVPNLTSFNANIPEIDVFITTIFYGAVNLEPQATQRADLPFSFLHEAEVGGECSIRLHSVDPTEGKLCLGYMWPLFQLPSLRKLSLVDVASFEAPEHLNNAIAISGITDLTMIGCGQSTIALKGCPSLTFTDAIAIAKLPRALTRLSMHVFDIDAAESRGKVPYAALWEALQQHAGTLQELEVLSHDWIGGIEPRKADSESPPLGMLKRFPRLETLHTQPEFLLHGAWYDEETAPLLRHNLPPNLKNLLLWLPIPKAATNFLEAQVRDVITSGDFPHLSRVVLEEDKNSKSSDEKVYGLQIVHKREHRWCGMLGEKTIDNDHYRRTWARRHEIAEASNVFKSEPDFDPFWMSWHDRANPWEGGQIGEEFDDEDDMFLATLGAS